MSITNSETHLSPVGKAPDGALIHRVGEVYGYVINKDGFPIGDEEEKVVEQAFFVRKSVLGACLIGIFGDQCGVLDYLVGDDVPVDVKWIPDKE